MNLAIGMTIFKQAISGASSSEDEKNRTAKAIARAMSGTRQNIPMRQLCHFFRADIDTVSALLRH
jgi:serine/threonine protein kinase HipA of HipAB toxin-antitoxin module